MRIDLPQCGLDTCRYSFDCNCTDVKRYKTCEFAYFKELEADGRLIELPCKVEDTVWAIFPTWTPMECEVVAIEILTSTVNIETKVVDTDADRIFWPADFGKTVFLTKEESEEALKRLQGNE